MASERSSLCHHCTDSIRVVETGWYVTWQHSEFRMRRVLQLWSLWLVSFAKSWYFSALIATSSIIQTRLLDTFIVVLVQFLVRFSDSQIMNSSHVPGVHDKRLAEFLVVRGSQHRRKSHWAANYVSGSDSSRNVKVDWYLVFIGIWQLCSKYDADTCNSNKGNTKFHEVWPCILSSSSYHCCWAPRPGWRRLGIDAQSPNPLLNFGMGNQWTLQTYKIKIDLFWTSPDIPSKCFIHFWAMLPCR